MSDIREDVSRAAKNTHASASELPAEQATMLRRAIIAKFAGGESPRSIWEEMKHAVSVQDPDSWLWLDEFVGSKPAILFFDEDRETSMFAFEDGSQIVPVLKECPAFEFYLMDPTLSYLICFNHHDFLIADGSAADWLMAKREVSEEPESGGTE